MAITETEALVLRTYNLAEADKIVVCLTRNAGLVRGVAKGSRRIKNRFGAALEPFTLLNISYYEKENQELVFMRHVEILKSHFNLSRDPDVLTGLAYMGDLVVEFSPPHQTNDKLFRMVNACLAAITSGPQDLQLIIRYFEIWILRLEGFLAGCFAQPVLKEKVRCYQEGRTRGCVQPRRLALRLLLNHREVSPPISKSNLLS
jgi:DNA repair protein RecO (recombination protein O)